MVVVAMVVVVAYEMDQQAPPNEWYLPNTEIVIIKLHV